MSFIDYTPYKLRDWIPIKKLKWSSLSRNPKAINFLSKNLDRVVWNEFLKNPNFFMLLEKKTLESLHEYNNSNVINWYKNKLTTLSDKEIEIFSKNPNAIKLIEQNIDNINWIELALNPNAIHLLEQSKHLELDNYNYPFWINLCQNPNAIHLLKKHTNKINWCELCRNSNPEAIPLLEKNLDKLDIVSMSALSSNPVAIHLLECNQDYIELSDLLLNPNASHLIEQNLDKLCLYYWGILCQNPNAVYLLEQNLDKIDFESLSSNPNAIHLLEKNLDKVDFKNLSGNPNAINLLEQNLDKIDWEIFSGNPSIFEIDYQVLRKRIQPFQEELIQKCFHPDRLVHYLETYGYDIGEELYN